MPPTDAAPTLTHDPDRRRERLTLFFATLIFVALVVTGAVGYRGFIEGDAANHYLIARFAVDQPANFVNVWARPLCTLLYALPAQIGRNANPPDIRAGVLATRALSLALALLVAAITYRLARRQGLRRPSLAVVFTYAQPIFFVHAFSEMTEIPFALLLAAAFWAYSRRRWLAMAALAGLLPLARPEGFAFLGLAAAALVWHRRFWWGAVLLLPFLAWNYAGARLTSAPAGAAPPAAPWYLWVKANWPYSATSAYGRGELWDLPSRVPLVVGTFVFPLTIAGIVLCLRKDPLLRPAAPEPLASKSSPADFHDPGPPAARPLHLLFWTAALPLLVLVGHTILWWRGWMGSNGGARYLVICTPFWALLTAHGAQWAADRWALRRPHLLASALALAPLLITFTGLSYPNLPLGPVAADKVAEHIADWWQGDPDLRRRYPHILTSLPSMSYYLDLDLSRPEHAAPPGKAGIRARTPGTILIWDPILGPTNSDQNLCLTPEEIRAAGWIFIKRFTNQDVNGQDWADLYLSPTDITGQPTPPPPPPAPK